MNKVRITVNQAAIQRGDANPIHVHHVECDTRSDVAEVRIYGPSRVVYGGPLADGARVWIETDGSVFGVVR